MEKDKIFKKFDFGETEEQIVTKITKLIACSASETETETEKELIVLRDSIALKIALVLMKPFSNDIFLTWALGLKIIKAIDQTIVWTSCGPIFGYTSIIEIPFSEIKKGERKDPLVFLQKVNEGWNSEREEGLASLTPNWEDKEDKSIINFNFKLIIPK